MSSYNIQQQNVINQFRSTNGLGLVLSDDAVVELMLKEMEKSGKVYPGFESLAISVIALDKTAGEQNIFGLPIVTTDDSLFSITRSTSQYHTLNPTSGQARAINFLNAIVNGAVNIVDERDKEGGDLSDATNYWKELWNDEYSRSNVKKQINKTLADVEQLEKAARGECFVSFIGKETPISFEEMFMQRRGVEFNEKAIADCEQKSQEYARVKNAYDTIERVKQNLHSATVGNLKSQLSPAKSTAVIIEAFKQ